MVKLVDRSVTVIHGFQAGQPKLDCGDRADATEDMLMVFDGASSTDDAPRFQDNRFSAGTYAAKVCELAVEVAILGSGEGSAADLLCEANKLIASRTPEGLPKHHLPMAAGALVRVHEDETYTWAIAGNCQIIVYDNDGNVEVLRKHIAGTRFEAERQMIREELERKEGRSLDINHPILKELYEKRVTQHNVSFPVLNGEKSFESFMLSSEWSGEGHMKDVAGFIVFTDGAAWPYDTNPQDVDAIATSIIDEGVDGYLEELLGELRRKPDHDDLAIVIGSVVHPSDPCGS